MVHKVPFGVELVLSPAHVGSGNHGDMVLIYRGKRHDAYAFILFSQPFNLSYFQISQVVFDKIFYVFPTIKLNLGILTPLPDSHVFQLIKFEQSWAHFKKILFPLTQPCLTGMGGSVGN